MLMMAAAQDESSLSPIVKIFTLHAIISDIGRKIVNKVVNSICTSNQ